MSKLSDFYNHNGTDIAGRNLKDMWEWSDTRLEEEHEYIQWMFPLNEGSQFNIDAPILTIEDITEIDVENVRESFRVICDFYGISFEGGFIRQNRITWSTKNKNWVTPGNHNFLRLTRIMKSLMLFGLENEAITLELFLMDLYDKNKEIIGEVTKSFWEDAL